MTLLSDRCFISRYCVLAGDNLISWKSKKLNIMERSSEKAN